MKQRLLFTFALILSTTFLTLHAQNWNEIINATATDSGDDDRFGYSVDIDGDYAIVGAYLNDGNATTTGAAYIFQRSGNTWVEQAKLLASDATYNDYFGWSVSISGDYAIVGAYLNDDIGSASGSAYVFQRSGSSWTEQAKLTASDASDGDRFGRSVSITGDYAIVSASYSDDNGSSSGSAYVFIRSGSNWTEQAKLMASDAVGEDRFGSSVSIAGDYAIVGAFQDDDGGQNSGSAYVFIRSGSSWTEQSKLTASDAAAYDEFGSSVSIASDYAIVGAYANDDNSSGSGSAYVFMRTGSSWVEQAKLIASDADANDNFGISVSIDDDSAIIGAYLNDDSGSASGSAYVFTRSGSSWTEQTKLTASDAAANDQFGRSVSISGGYAIVGAPLNDDNGIDSGSAYFFNQVTITPDTDPLPDLSAQCESTPIAPTANSGTITATADVALPIATQGTTIVTWTYDDGIGNTLAQTQNIIIDDTTVPTLTFGDLADALIDSCATEVIVPSPVISENCLTNTTLDFDGTNDRVTIPYNASLAFTTEFSVQAWIYPRANSYSRILTKYSGGGNNQGEFVFDTYDGSIPTYYANGRGLRLAFTGPNGGYILSPNVLNLNTWNHVVGTFNNGIIKIYVNGVEVNSGTTTFTSIPTSSLDYAIGEDIFVNQNEYFSGQIDELSIWNKALKPSDITIGYNKILEGTEPGLAAYYDFEEGTGSSVLIDKSINGNDGVLTNMDSNTDWVTSAAPITMASLTNNITGTSDASGTYPEGQTTVTWTATDASGNQSTLEQIVNIDCSITYTFNNGVWTPSDPNGIALAEDDLVIASGYAIINTNTTCDSVTVNPGAGLTINASVTLTASNGLTLESNSTSYSSLILDGIVAGTMSYERHVNINGSGTTGSNDLISPPLTGQDFASFATANPNILNNGSLFLFGPFEKVTGQYVNWASTETATLDAGVGYRTGTTDNGTVTFTGTANNGTVTNNIINAGTNNEEWNLVGNPYPSYLNVQDFLIHEVNTGVINLNLFEASTAAIYGYDGNAQNGWAVYNLANTTASTVIAPGQGFFVSADTTNDDLYDLEFTPGMRSTGSSDDFIVGRNAELVYLKLDLSSGSETSRTDFYFNDNASQGLDIGFDAEVFDSSNLYSHLLQDNEGKAMALQALNPLDLSEVSIPLGVNANQGEQITFSISDSTLPASVNVYLDDVVVNTSTLLNSGDYVITPTTNLSGTGRFFLRTSEDALSTIENSLETLNIFALNGSKEIVVSGSLQEATSLVLYDIQGRKVFTTDLDKTTLNNRIDVSSLSGGVYIVTIESNAQQKTQKVVLK